MWENRSDCRLFIHQPYKTHTLENGDGYYTILEEKNSIAREVNCMVTNPSYVTMKLATAQSHGSHQSYSCPLNIFP